MGELAYSVNDEPTVWQSKILEFMLKKLPSMRHMPTIRNISIETKLTKNGILDIYSHPKLGGKLLGAIKEKIDSMPSEQFAVGLADALARPSGEPEEIIKMIDGKFEEILYGTVENSQKEINGVEHLIAIVGASAGAAGGFFSRNGGTFDTLSGLIEIKNGELANKPPETAPAKTKTAPESEEAEFAAEKTSEELPAQTQEKKPEIKKTANEGPAAEPPRIKIMRKPKQERESRSKSEYLDSKKFVSRVLKEIKIIRAIPTFQILSAWSGIEEKDLEGICGRNEEAKGLILNAMAERVRNMPKYIFKNSLDEDSLFNLPEPAAGIRNERLAWIFISNLRDYAKKRWESELRSFLDISEENFQRFKKQNTALFREIGNEIEGKIERPAKTEEKLPLSFNQLKLLAAYFFQRKSDRKIAEFLGVDSECVIDIRKRIGLERKDNLPAHYGNGKETSFNAFMKDRMELLAKLAKDGKPIKLNILSFEDEKRLEKIINAVKGADVFPSLRFIEKKTGIAAVKVRKLMRNEYASKKIMAALENKIRYEMPEKNFIACASHASKISEFIQKLVDRRLTDIILRKIEECGGIPYFSVIAKMIGVGMYVIASLIERNEECGRGILDAVEEKIDNMPWSDFAKNTESFGNVYGEVKIMINKRVRRQIRIEIKKSETICFKESFRNLGIRDVERFIEEDAELKVLMKMKVFEISEKSFIGCVSRKVMGSADEWIKTAMNERFACIVERRISSLETFPFAVNIGASCGLGSETIKNLFQRLQNSNPILFERLERARSEKIQALLAPYIREGISDAQIAKKFGTFQNFVREQRQSIGLFRQGEAEPSGNGHFPLDADKFPQVKTMQRMLATVFPWSSPVIYDPSDFGWVKASVNGRSGRFEVSRMISKNATVVVLTGESLMKSQQLVLYAINLLPQGGLAVLPVPKNFQPENIAMPKNDFNTFAFKLAVWEAVPMNYGDAGGFERVPEKESFMVMQKMKPDAKMLEISASENKEKFRILINAQRNQATAKSSNQPIRRALAPQPA